MELEGAGIAERLKIRVKESKGPRMTPGFQLRNQLAGSEVHCPERQSMVFGSRIMGGGGGVGRVAPVVIPYLTFRLVEFWITLTHLHEDAN